VNAIKIVLYVVFFSILLVDRNVSAEEFGNSRVELMRYTSMGGVDITLDEDTPANANLAEPSFTVVGLGIETTISRFIGVADIGVEAANIDWYIDSSNQIESLHRLAYQLDQLSAMMDDPDVELEIRSRLDLPNGDIPIGDHSIHLGAYTRSFVAAGIYVPPDMGTGIDLNGFYLDLGEKTNVVHTGLVADAGLVAGYGFQLPLSKQRRVALGAQLRGFFRLRSDQLVVMDQRVWSNENITAPESAGDIELLKGWGTGIDLYTAFKLDDLMGTVFGIYLEDAITPVWYNDGSTELVTPRLGMGVSVRPLDKWNGNDPLILGIDVENIQTFDPTLEIGAASVLGTKQFHVIPNLGAAFNKKNLFRDKSDVAISAGVASTIASFRLDLAILYNILRGSVDGGFYAGVRL
jgi:hypothetical protein